MVYHDTTRESSLGQHFFSNSLELFQLILHEESISQNVCLGAMAQTEVLTWCSVRIMPLAAQLNDRGLAIKLGWRRT